MRNNWQLFLKDESGATAIEYAIIAGLIGVAVVLSIGEIKDKIVTLFALIGTQLDAAL